MTSKHATKPLVLAAVTAAAFLVSACGSSKSNEESTNDDPVAAALRSLNVDTTKTARIDDQGDALPDSYRPLGEQRAVFKFDELFSAGFRLGSHPGAVALDKLATDAGGTTSTGGLGDFSAVTWEASPYRAAAAGDVDGDGFEEIAVVYWDTDDSLLHLALHDDASEGFAAYDWPLSATPVSDVAIVVGDFNGDGTGEIALGLSADDTASIVYLIGDEGVGYQIDSAASVLLDPEQPGSQASLRMKAGNIDHDSADELAVVLNERFSGMNGVPMGIARYFVYDDAGAGSPELSHGEVQARDGVLYTAMTGDVALGDVDADNIDEVIVAGLSNIKTGGGCDDLPTYAVGVLDDAAHDFAVVAGKNYTPTYACESYDSVSVSRIVANALDIDGDLVDEIQVNQVVFDDLQEGATPWTLVGAIPPTDFFNSSFASNNAGGDFDPATSALVVGELTGDKREDIAELPRWGSEVVIWGVDDSGSFGRLGGISNDNASQDRPILVAANVDDDSFIARYVPDSYAYVFTEPVVVAALAGPPCARGIGQNTDACTTAFGKSTSQTVSSEAAVTLSATAHVGAKGGFELPIIKVGVEAEFEASTTVAVTAAIHAAYTVTKSLTFETGPLEDTVVFTTVPYDQYTYEIVSHPDASLIGKTVVLSIPREPITLQAERGFFNSHVPDGSFQVDSAVFAHQLGDPSTYPSVADKNNLIGLFGGLQYGPQTVGIGSGTTSLAIDVATEVGGSVTMSVSYEETVKLTAAGVMAGFSVGVEASATLGYSVGNATSYTGTVGEIDPEQFNADNQYAYGIFSYVYEAPTSGQEFDVINYWVE